MYGLAYRLWRTDSVSLLIWIVQTLLPALDNKMNMRVRALVDYIRVSRKGPFYPTLYVVKEGGDPALRQWALSQLVEDRDPGPAGTSYAQFLNKLRERVNVAK